MLGAIVGGLAEAYYGIPADIEERAVAYLPDEFINVINEFERKYGDPNHVLKKSQRSIEEDEWER